MVYKPVNKEFYEKTRAFILTAVSFLVSCVEGGEELPSRIVEKEKIGWERVYMSSHSPLTLYSSFIDRHRKEIEELPEFEPLHNLMSSDTTISKHLNKLVGTCENLTHRTLWDYLSYFLYKQISRSTDKLEFDPETFDNMYYDLEQFFYHNNVDLQVFSPLHNFSSDVDEIDLGNGLRIRRSTTSEPEGILSQNTFSQIPYSDMNYLEWKIELTYQTEKVILEKPNSMSYYTSEALTIYGNVNAIFDKLVTALRLFKSGIVGFNIIKRKPMADIPIIVRDPFAYSISTYSQFSGPQYTLTGTEVSEFRSFWEKFNKTKLYQIAPLGVAIRRFNYAYGRGKLEDKLMDYMIAFEALFFKQGEMGEFRHKLAVRVSRLLKQNYEERKDIMGEMKNFYNKRSAVVHGEGVDIGDDFVNEVEGYLRESIRLFLERLQSLRHDEIISILDLGEP